MVIHEKMAVMYLLPLIK